MGSAAIGRNVDHRGITLVFLHVCQEHRNAELAYPFTLDYTLCKTGDSDRENCTVDTHRTAPCFLVVFLTRFFFVLFFVFVFSFLVVFSFLLFFVFLLFVVWGLALFLGVLFVFFKFRAS